MTLYEHLWVYANNLLQQVDDLLLQELLLLHEFYPNAFARLPEAIAQAREGKILVRWYATLTGTASFYGLLFPSAREASVATHFIRGKLGSYVARFPFVLFRDLAEQGTLDVLTPIELWEYLALDAQQMLPGHEQSEYLEKKNPYLLVFLAFLDKALSNSEKP